MRSRNALRRALLILGGAVLCTALFGASANADDGTTTTPRALPAARALPRTFGSYDDLIAYASAIAADQSALDEQFAQTIRAHASTAALIDAIAPPRGHGGALFDRDARQTQQQLDMLDAQAASLAATERQLIASGALTAPAAPWRMPTNGEITQPFGPTDVWVEPARTYGGVSYAHFHDGIDIAGPWAADVVAPARGRVVFVGAMMDGAEVIVIAHDAGVVTMYVHLDAWQNAPRVQAGDEVAAGQKIGTQGLTGITTGQHLHWAAYRNGRLIDPLSLLSN